MALKNILSISTDDETGNYQIAIPEGSNLAETMFAISAMIRCFVRDGVIDNYQIAVAMLVKYLSDTQFDEVEETE